jgi:hypothetical protein
MDLSRYRPRGERNPKRLEGDSNLDETVETVATRREAK